MTNIKLLVIKMDSSNDPIFITTNVEYTVTPHFIRSVKHPLDVRKVHKRMRLYEFMPRLHRLSSRGVHS